jgi:glucose/arabinose dehydrogenase
VLCAAGFACGGGGGGHGDGGQITGITLAQAFNGRMFNSPVKLVQHPTDAHRWYVVEQGGHVKTFLDNDTAPATNAATVSGLSSDSEQGLLGMAFAPDFTTSGEIYLAYTDSSNRLVLSRWVSGNGGSTFIPNSANPVVLAIPHTPSTNHNGSDIAFGSDGFLYYSTGDGGGSDDPEDNAQNRNKLLGKILRIDVNSVPPTGKTYAIPTTNPFHSNPQCNTGPGTTSCPEIYAYGFRNPWRMNFDSGPGGNGKLYVGDVGQGAQEEIDIVTNGGNFGWDCLEGEVTHDTRPSCIGPFVPPEVVYDDTAGQDSVTGGAVYRGSIPGLVGMYIYTDFYHGPFFGFDTRVDNAPAQALSITEDHISAFGHGRDGEIYPVDYDGQIWKIVPSPG